jgi:hypothetical protein
MTLYPPEVLINVDPSTGVWTTDQLPMIYMPRHFFINYHIAMEESLGENDYSRAVWKVGYQSAWQWCERESATHKLRGIDVFRHYMRRLSQRGWGRFSIQSIDEATGSALVRVDHSAFVLGRGTNTGRKTCYVFSSWLPGSLEWAARDMGSSWNLTCSEIQCCSEGMHDHCIFETRPLR